MDNAQQVVQYLTEKQQASQIPGLSWAVIKAGQVLAKGGIGEASLAFSVPATEHTLYPISSSSKMFAGVAAMCLIEAGKLSLEASIRRYVPEAPESWAGITLAHILSHTSGINDFYRNPASGFADLPQDKRDQLSAAEAMTYSYRFPLTTKPGDKWAYSLAGYVLLGLVIERGSGQAYPDFVEEAIFVSLGLSCRWGGTAVEIPNRNPVLYARDDGQLVNHTVNFSPFSYPAGGLNATALDIARFLSALQAGQLLSPQSLKRMWEPVRLNDGSTFSYGLGFDIADYNGHPLVNHEGGGQSWNLHLPHADLSIAVICNLSGARADEVVTDLADVVLEGGA